MQSHFDRYRAAGVKGVQFQLPYQQADGAFIWDGFPPDAYHKQPYSWALAGYAGQVHKLFNWVKANALQPEGGLKDYRGDVYKQSWFFHGAHRLRRFDISYPIMEFLLSCQTPCGGFPHFAADPRLRALSTCWAGIAALSFGRIDVAAGAAECCVNMLEQQPDAGKFYYLMTLDGGLVTQATHPDAAFINLNAPRQPYWEIGLPCLLMGRLHQATGEARYLDLAERFFERHLDCFEDAFASTGSGKSALAAAVHYQNTGDLRAREAATGFLDHLLAAQRPDGCWCGVNGSDALLILIDHSAEFNVWIHEVSAILEGMPGA